MSGVMRWYLSLGLKFARVVPWTTACGVFATLVSQISAILAFLLPLKVVVLLGSERTPAYFPSFFADMDRDWLVLFLSISAIAFYALHLAAERVISFCANSGAQYLLAKNRKMILFENQELTAVNGYQAYSRLLSSGVFILFSVLLLAWKYPVMALVLAGYFVLIFTLYWAGCQVSEKFSEVMAEKWRDSVNIAGNLGFLLSFTCMMVDFIFWSPPNLLLAIVTLLLSRQVFAHAAGVVSGLIDLQRQRMKLDALFFHGKVLLSSRNSTDNSMWPMLAPESKSTWVRSVLSELARDDSRTLECQWYHTGLTNIAVLKVKASESQRSYFVKLFESNLSSIAQHEAELLARPPRGLPALPLIGVTQLKNFQCHLFLLPDVVSYEGKNIRSLAERMCGILLLVEPPVELTQRYLRSRPLLGQRISEEMFTRLRVASDAQSLALIDTLISHINVIKGLINALPLTFTNPSVNGCTMFSRKNDNDCALHWGHWGLEPVGAGWPISRLQTLKDNIVTAGYKRHSLKEVKPEQAELAALMFALEVEVSRQRFVDALALLPDILVRLNHLRSMGSPVSNGEYLMGS